MKKKTSVVLSADLLYIQQGVLLNKAGKQQVKVSMYHPRDRERRERGDSMGGREGGKELLLLPAASILL